MAIPLKKETSLGFEYYYNLGFDSEKDLELEISKHIKTRPKFKK